MSVYDDESQLLARCRAGDEAAWATVYERYAPTVARFLHRGIGPAADHDDLLQQVFVELYTSLPRFRGNARLSTWLYRIASNLASKAHRSSVRRQRRADAYRDALAVAPPVPLDPSRQTAAREALARLEQAAWGLSTKLRLVWVLVELEGQTPAEAAEILRIRKGAARSRLLEARRQIMVAMQDARPEPARPPGRSAAPTDTTPNSQPHPERSAAPARSWDGPFPDGPRPILRRKADA